MNRPDTLRSLSLLAALALTGLAAQPAVAAGGPVRVTSAFYDGYVLSGTTETEEAVQIMNVSGASVDLSGWSFTDNEATVTFPAGTSLAAGQRLWLAYQATDFRGLFGFAPDFEYGADSDPSIPNMAGTAPRLANGGDEVVLKDGTGTVADALVYKAGSTAQAGWSGVSVVNYNVFPMNPSEQVLARKLDETTGYPTADTDTADDWNTSKTAGATLYGPVRQGDIDGKKIVVPGWDMGIYGGATSATQYWVPLKVTETADSSILVAPDNIYDAYIAAINAASQSLFIEGYTFGHREIGEAVAARAAAGVQVKVLLEGGPCCTDAPDQGELWVVKQIVDAGGQVYFMHDDVTSAAGAKDRYNFQHAKFTIVDAGTPNQVLLTGSENLNCGSMPNDNKANGTAGNRGTYVKTTAPSVIDHYLAIFNLDLDPANHRDLVPYGSLPVNTWDGVTVPASCASSDGTLYAIQKPAPLALTGVLPMEVVQAPENALRYSDSLIGMVRRAGAGDVVLVEQAYERKFWGLSNSNPETDPNPRLEAYIDAARRGAKVRILFDAEFDDPADPRNNTATVAYVAGVASAEGLDLQARNVDCTGCTGPAGGGIHNKMVMVKAGTSAWVHTGSINGSENSSKFNREMALQIESLDAYCYLYDVFNYDWLSSGGTDVAAGCGGAPNTPPSASIASPAGGATVSGTVTIQVSAADAEDAAGSLTVEVAIDGGAWQAATYNAGSGFYERAWDTTAVPNGSHSIAARATDSGSATTNASPVNVTVSNVVPTSHVGDLDGSGALQGGGWKATVVVSVHDSGHALVPGATVSGSWSGGFNGSGSCTTNGSGQCSVVSGNIPRKKTSATFTVTGVTHATFSYDAAANHDPDGDSNGTSITVTKP